MQADLFAVPEHLPLAQADVSLYRSFLSGDDAQRLFERLRQALQWEQPTITVVGRQHKIPRLQAWYGDCNAVYAYSGQTFTPNPWTPDLDLIRHRVEAACSTTFNSVLVNYYRTGADGMGMHSDNEPELGLRPVIASLSLGAPRRFVFQPARRRGCNLDSCSPSGGEEAKRRCVLHLDAGDLLVMAGETQRHWRHGVPKTQVPVGGRINLTFRYILP